MEGYSYTTISKHPGQEADVFVALHLDSKATTRYFPGADGKTGHVQVEHGDVDLTIAAVRDVDRAAQADGIAAVRKLADVLTAYLADLDAHAQGEQAA